MKTYKCDSCGVTIDNPYTAKMKEFCLACDYDEHGVFPIKWKNKVKVHLCEHCYTGLYIIVKRKETEKNEHEEFIKLDCEHFINTANVAPIADTVKKMQVEINKTLSSLCKGDVSEICRIIDQIAKEMLEEDKIND